jgi:hypothetical protein
VSTEHGFTPGLVDGRCVACGGTRPGEVPGCNPAAPAGRPVGDDRREDEPCAQCEADPNPCGSCGGEDCVKCPDCYWDPSRGSAGDDRLVPPQPAGPVGDDDEATASELNHRGLWVDEANFLRAGHAGNYAIIGQIAGGAEDFVRRALAGSGPADPPTLPDGMTPTRLRQIADRLDALPSPRTAAEVRGWADALTAGTGDRPPTCPMCGAYPFGCVEGCTGRASGTPAEPPAGKVLVRRDDLINLLHGGLTPREITERCWAATRSCGEEGQRMNQPTTLGYSGLTGTVYVLLANGQKRPVPEGELAAVIAGYLNDHDLTVGGVRYGVLSSEEQSHG